LAETSARDVRRPWYRDGAGDALAILGIVALGVGAPLWGIGYGDARALAAAPTYVDYQQAHASGVAGWTYQLAGVGCVVGGGLLLVAAATRHAVRRR
jgi:hypothetical protein